MNINLFNILATNNNLNINNKTSFGIRLPMPLNKDSVEIKKKNYPYFETQEKAIEHYKKLGEQVNKALEDEDELSAFELLGYDVSTDFDTDEITINGDYDASFHVYAGKPVQLHKISYKEANIDENQLMKNVIRINGSISDLSNFDFNENFVIDKNQSYSAKIFKKLDKIMQKRAEEVREALLVQDYEQAFKILGYQTSTDKEGNITIEGDYSNTIIKNNANLNDYDIDENELLSKVVKINGKSDIGTRFIPDHFIITSFEDGNFYTLTPQIRNEYVQLDPRFIDTTTTVRKQLEEGNNFEALKTLGFDVQKEDDNSITIIGDFTGKYTHSTPEYSKSYKYDDIGIDETALLKGVNKIDGDFYIRDDREEPLSKDFEVTGLVLYSYSSQEELFSNFLSSENISSLYDRVDENIISNFVKYNALQPSFKTRLHSYFKNIEGTNKELLDDISQRRDEILTADEVCEKYSLSNIIMANALRKGTIKPYGIESFNERYNIDTTGFLYDIADEGTRKELESLSKTRASRQNKIKQDNDLNMEEFKNACIQKRVRANGENNALTEYPASALEAFGYGSKEDLAAQCRLRTDSYKLVNYILNNDTYNISTAAMMDILLNSKRNNPSIYNLNSLLNKLGDDKKAVIQAIIDGRIKVVTTNPYRQTYYKDYYINLFDESNYECLSKIDSKALQEILSERKEALDKYKQENAEYVKQIKDINITTKEEAIKQTQREFEAIEAQRIEERKTKEIEKKRQKEERNRMLSLRNTIAWVLCPKTRQIMSELMNPHIREVMKKNKELQEIREELLAHEITIEEAEDRINKLNLSTQDRIDVLAYEKSAWELAGTEEWTEGLKQAKTIMQSYKEQGISGIENEEVRNRIIEWEKSHI